MEIYQYRSRSFIIRIWIEPREIENEAPIWRGTVEEVGEERPEQTDGQSYRQQQWMAFTRISDFVTFLAQRMKQMGIPEDQIN